MNMELLLSIVGAFLVMGLGINAFFLRGIFQDLNEVKIKLAQIFVKAAHEEKEREELKANQKEIFERLNILEREVLK